MPRVERDCSEMGLSHITENTAKVGSTYGSSPRSRVRTGTNAMTLRRDIGLIP